MENTNALLSTSYFAPIQYYCKLIHYPNILIEQWENYSKQSYRNRCYIYGSNGALAISIPIVKATNKKILAKDVQISYDTNWQKLHWKGIESAYKSSPFYEYYINDLEHFFSRKWEYLLDLNLNIQEKICEILEIENKNTLTEDFIPLYALHVTDFRNTIHPKSSKKFKDPDFNPHAYTQVFGDKHGFIPNLSILDLIFNLGPDSSDYLKSCIK